MSGLKEFSAKLVNVIGIEVSGVGHDLVTPIALCDPSPRRGVFGIKLSRKKVRDLLGDPKARLDLARLGAAERLHDGLVAIARGADRASIAE